MNEAQMMLIVEIFTSITILVAAAGNFASTIDTSLRRVERLSRTLKRIFKR